jgi:ribonuclease HI
MHTNLNQQPNNPNLSNIITIYTDGACLGNPGKGGWAAILLYKNHSKEISGNQAYTTNNRMELTAVIEALKTLNKPSNIIIYTDSTYVKDGITSWLTKWQQNNWQTSKKQPVKNIDLWQELNSQSQNHQINWQWVKAHNGNQYNEIVDKLARKSAQII